MDQGFVEASGSLNFPAHMYDWLETITLETDVKVSSLQVAEILEAGAAISKLPRGNGVANADFDNNYFSNSFLVSSIMPVNSCSRSASFDLISADSEDFFSNSSLVF